MIERPVLLSNVQVCAGLSCMWVAPQPCFHCVFVRAVDRRATTRSVWSRLSCRGVIPGEVPVASQFIAPLARSQTGSDLGLSMSPAVSDTSAAHVSGFFLSRVALVAPHTAEDRRSRLWRAAAHASAASSASPSPRSLLSVMQRAATSHDTRQSDPFFILLVHPHCRLPPRG